MHSVAWRKSGASVFPARRVCSRRIALSPRRPFHTTRVPRLSVTPPSPPADRPQDDPKESPSRVDGERSSPKSPEDLIAAPPSEFASSEASIHLGKGRSRGRDRAAGATSSPKKTTGYKRPDGIPPVVIPQWFVNQNVRLKDEQEDLVQGKLLAISKDGKVYYTDELNAESQDWRHDDVKGEGHAKYLADLSPETSVYQIKLALVTEIMAGMVAGLSLTGPNIPQSFSAGKAHLQLHCPVDGGTYFLDKIVERCAHAIGADLVRFDAQDLAEIGSEYMKENSEAPSDSIWSLGYDAQGLSRPGDRDHLEFDEDAVDFEDESVEGSDGDAPLPRGSNAFPSFSRVIPLGIIGNLTKLAEKGLTSISQISVPDGDRSDHQNGISSRIPRSRWHDQKITALLETLINSPGLKRPKTTQPDPETIDVAAQVERNDEADVPLIDSSKTQDNARKTIIFVRDHKQLNATRLGGPMLDKLVELIQLRRKKGQEVLLVGTTASNQLTPEISKSAIDEIQSEGSDSVFRTIFVTPEAAGPSGGLYHKEELRRLREINMRNIKMVIRKTLDPPESSDDLKTVEISNMDLNTATAGDSLALKLEERILSFDEVHRIIITAIGYKITAERLEGNKVPLSLDHIAAAFSTIHESDNSKAEWVRDEKQLTRPIKSTERAVSSSPGDLRLRRIAKSATRHEKQLLRGVINPENLRTTFNDVHAPTETIDALKTLTTLSLVRPDAFKYGVLATDRLSGLLLYGPPGTGKTLLAKAVAKESGATVLEVSGSEVYDMYVGESEKNVRAIFSLAKKLSPCVVFIDEADAIFGSRGNGVQRSTHRELINQFLREWDGMNEHSAFIMVATNRPFDLDDAVLRRLPRRLLVDLPIEQDRESILRIHLKDEVLDPNVSLAQLAKDTPLYSGSDLKNLAVAAALACVREENAEAAASADQAGFEYPEKRVLHNKHFTKALEEISASINEDMSSLGAIRKFDEKYGDRRGRRKKPGYGFRTGAEKKEKDAARVRG